MTRQVAGARSSHAPTKPNKAGSRKRVRLAAAAVLALSIWAGATAWGQMAKFDEKAERIEALDGKLAKTQAVNDTLKREIERLNDKEYRQEMMRKDMHLSKEGETVFDLPRANP